MDISGTWPINASEIYNQSLKIRGSIRFPQPLLLGSRPISIQLLKVSHGVATAILFESSDGTVEEKVALGLLSIPGDFFVKFRRTSRQSFYFGPTSDSRRRHASLLEGTRQRAYIRREAAPISSD